VSKDKYINKKKIKYLCRLPWEMEMGNGKAYTYSININIVIPTNTPTQATSYLFDGESKNQW
jgi:hypothetical protein